MLRPRFGVFVGAWRRATPVLDTPRVPERLVGRQSEFGAVPERLAPVFRDRDELATSTNLGETLRHALQQSANLVVICSPAKANLRLAQGRYEEARTLAVAARAILERDMPDDSWQVGAAKAVEGAALSRLRRYVEAEPLLKSSIPALGDSTIPGLQQATLQCLVELYMAWGRPQEADGFR